MKHQGFLLLSFFILFSSQAMADSSDIQARIEAPEQEDVEAGIINVMGWATDVRSGVSIRSVTMTIDDGEEEQIVHGATRRDVERAFPEDAEALRSGFAATISTRKLGNGPHTITITVTNDRDEEKVLTRMFRVSNPPHEGATSWWEEIDLSRASARVAAGRILLEGVVINGRRYDSVELVFDKRTSAFQLGSWVNDLDGDGEPDDGRRDQGDLFVHSHWTGTGSLSSGTQSCTFSYKVEFLDEGQGFIESQLVSDDSPMVECGSGSAKFTYELTDNTLVIDLYEVEGAVILGGEDHFELVVLSDDHVAETHVFTVQGYTITREVEFFRNDGP